MRKQLLSADPRLRTLILHHDDCLAHSSCRPSEWEGPDRVDGILRDIRDPNQFAAHELEITDEFNKATVELLSRAHSPEYIAMVDNLSKQIQRDERSSNSIKLVVPFTPQVQKHIYQRGPNETKDPDSCDTLFSSGTLRAARRAAGAVAYAVDRVLSGRNRNAFCLVRPPGL